MNKKIATGGNYIHSNNKFQVNGETITTSSTRGGGYISWMIINEIYHIEAGKSTTVICGGGHRDSHPIYLCAKERAQVRMIRSGTPAMESKVEVIGAGSYDFPE